MAFIYDLTDTWNASGTTFNAIKMNVTDSASAAASKLVTLQVGGSERFGVRKDGQGYFAGNVGIGTTAPVSYSGYSTLTIQNTNGGVINLRNGGNTAQAEIAVTSAETYMAAISALPLTFKTTNTERMRITSSGNVGIGTSAPSFPLQVNGGLAAGRTTSQYVSITGDASFNYVTGVSQVGNAKPFLIASDANSTALIFGTLSVERMRIDNSGNVGIGTSSPAVPLEVAGNIRSLGLFQRFDNSGLTLSGGTTFNTGGAGISLRGVSSGFNAHGMEFYAGGSERMRIDSSGNLLVGKTAINLATVGIEARGAGILGATRDGGEPLFLRRNTSDGAIASFNRDGSTVGTISVTTTATTYNTSSTSGITGVDANTVAIRTNSAERMRITDTGAVLIGSTVNDPGSASNGSVAGFGHLSNTLYLSKSSAEALHINRFTSDGNAVVFRRTGTQVGTISVTTTATTYNTSSDYRLKDIDGPIQNSGAYIDALKPVQGSWKADGSRFIGLLAHEVQEVSETQIATGEKDGEEMQAMDYSAPEIIANLIAEIQSLRARVAQLEGN